MVIRSGLVILSLGLASSTALAEEPRFADHDTDVSIGGPHDQVAVYGTGAIGLFAREAGTSSGGAMGGEAAYIFRGVHGIRLGYAYGAGIFGPAVHVVDLAYSAQWNTSRKLEGVSGSFGAILGPSLGIVSYGGNMPDVHATFGARAGLFANLHVWWFLVGVDASYRLGLSGYGAESLGCVGLHAGIAFDFARRIRD